MKKIVAIVFLTSNLASLWVFINRGDLVAFEWSVATLGDLYALPETGPRMTGFDYKDNILTIKIENIGNCEGWHITGPGGLDISVSDPYPSFPIREGDHDYIVNPIQCTNEPLASNLVFKFIKRSPENTTSDLVFQDVIRLHSMPLVFSPREGPDFARWIPPLNDFGEQDIQRAERFLADHGIETSMPSLEKIARISHALDKTLPTGRPPEYLNRLTPMQILDEALSGRAEVFCRQHALTQSFLSNVAGVPTRIVGSGRVLDGVMFSGHGFVESYIEEQSRWAYSDLSHGISYITDRNGFVLNAADILSIVSNKTGGDLSVASNQTPLSKQVPWGPVQALLEPWYNKNASLVFWGGKDRTAQHIGQLPLMKTISYRVQRYLFEPSYYLGYQQGYSLHWLRGALFLSSILSGLVLLGLWLRRPDY